MAADVIELARRHNDAFNSHDPDARMAIESSEVEVLFPGGVELHGPEQVIQMVNAFWEAMPDGKIDVERQWVVGDTVLAEGFLRGTQTGVLRTPQGEIPASGNPVSLRYAAVKRFEDGKLVSEHLYFDQLEFLQQLGAMT